MTESFTLTIGKTKSNTSKNVYTRANSITIGNDLNSGIRIREPSIEKTHLQIHLDKMNMFVSGKDVFLNDRELEVGQTYPFSLGDMIKIHDTRITIKKTEPNTDMEEGFIIKPVPKHLEDAMNDIQNMKEEIKQGIPEDEVDVVAKIEQGENGNRETIVKREVLTTQFIEGGVLHQETTEKIHVEEVEEIRENKSEESVESLKDVPEIQQAVKILEDGQKEIDVEMALEDGDLTSIKEAISNKKDDLNTEIKETLDPEITVTDTPIDPTLTKRVMKDLGEVVLEKEILADAEKIVDEKISEEDKADAKDVKEVRNEEEREEEAKAVKDVKTEEEVKSEEEAKDVISEEEVKDVRSEEDKADEEEITPIEEKQEGEFKPEEIKDEEPILDKKEEQINDEKKDSVETAPLEETKKPQKENKPVKNKKTVKKEKTPAVEEPPAKKTKKSQPSSSFISRTPRRAASQKTEVNPLMTPIAKRTRRNSSVPQVEEKKSSRSKK